MIVVSTKYGKLEGFLQNGVVLFRGIPYAKPPVREFRFLPPREMTPWSGLKECKQYGHVAPQIPVPGLSQLKLGEEPDEDCLYLNVVTPSLSGRHPVLFWIHGGAFQKGSSTLGIDPVSFAKEGITVVSANYRLGALGFLDVSGILGNSYEQSGNSGLLDILTALRWTRDCIASFGGDQDNVTIMGQSAGAKITSTLTVMKEARGLFKNAVMCSGSLQCVRDKETALTIADRFMENAGIGRNDGNRLLTMSWKEILKAQTPLVSGLNLHTFGPVMDGIHLEQKAILSQIPKRENCSYHLLMGTNRDEMNLYQYIYHVHSLDETLAYQLFGTWAPRVLQEYEKIPKDKDFMKNFSDYMTLLLYQSPCIRMAEEEANKGQDVYLYRLDWDRQYLKACHASETQFIMGQSGVIQDVDSSSAHEKLQKEMHGSFLQFIRTGRPSFSSLPQWHAFTKAKREMLIFDGPCHVESCPPLKCFIDMPYELFHLLPSKNGFNHKI